MDAAVDRLVEPARSRGGNRIAWLVTLNIAVLLVGSLSELLVPRRFGFYFLRECLHGLAIAPYMLLVIWCGLGTSSVLRRAVWGIVGAGYMAVCLQIAQHFVRASLDSSLLPDNWPQPTLADYLADAAEGAAWLIAIGALLVGLLLVMRRYSAKLQHFDRPGDAPQVRQTQFSISQVLVATFFVAVFLGLARGARHEWPEFGPDWRGRFQQGLFVVDIAVNILIALWAALAPGRVIGRTAIALMIIFIVGTCYGVATLHAGELYDIPGGIQFTLKTAMIPTAFVMANLLVVRSCGYRLVPVRRCGESKA